MTKCFDENKPTGPPPATGPGGPEGRGPGPMCVSSIINQIF